MGTEVSWYISGGDHSSLSDHELILIGWEDGDADVKSLKQGRATGWNIQALYNDKEEFE